MSPRVCSPAQMAKSLFVAVLRLAPLALLAAACAQTTPAVRHYQLAATLPAGAACAPAGSPGVVLAVDHLVADAAYDDARMVYRTGPYSLAYDHYHRWATSPAPMLADALRQGLRQSGCFGAVLTGYEGSAELTLSGRLVRLEEYAIAGQPPVARLALELYLRQARTGELLWSGTAEAEAPMRARDPEELARAASAALAQVVAESVPRLLAAGEQRGLGGQREQGR